MSEEIANQVVLYEKHGATAWITLNRPEALNAINVEVCDGLARAVRHADADPEVRVMVLRGAGARAFSAGADIKEFRPLESASQSRQSLVPGNRWIDAVGGASKPMIAAIHGFCLGGGLEIALMCDLRIAAEDAQFGLPEVSLGIIPGAGGTQRLWRVVGVGHALRMILTGERIDAQEAHRIGLVTQVLPSGRLVEEAERLANVIASHAPLALAMAKEAVCKGPDLGLTDGLRLEADLSALLLTTHDYVEAATAFAEKRRPVFRGR